MSYLSPSKHIVTMHYIWASTDKPHPRKNVENVSGKLGGIKDCVF